MCTFNSRTSCGRFLQSLSLFLGNKLLNAKNVSTTVKWLQVGALQKILPPKLRLFSAFAKLPNHCFLEFLSAKFYSNYYCGRENQDNSACQALIENFVENIDYMSSVHFRPEN